MDAASRVIARSSGALESGTGHRFALRVTIGGLPTELIVAFIAGEPGMAQRMLAEHRDDGSGHCRVCGPESARTVWPCPLRGLAEQASQHKPSSPR
jgi:hypothetical protein